MLSEYHISYVGVLTPCPMLCRTGKTVVARMMPKMMSRLGLLEDKIVETTAQEIQGQYVGQSEAKAREKIEAASGGVLFVDEAHNLGNSHFSRQAAQVLMTATLEEQHKGNTMIILAGYPDSMHSMMQGLDPGFQRRFRESIEFEDWSAEDCVDYLKQLCNQEEIGIDDDATEHVLDVLRVIKERPGWGNASDSKDVFERLKKCIAVKAAGGGSEKIELGDATEAMAQFLQMRPEMQSIDLSGSMNMSFAAGISPQRYSEHQSPHVSRSLSQSSRKARIVAVEEEEERDDVGGEDPIFAALQLACVELGYDRDQESRKQLIGILESVVSGESFSEDILEHVTSKTGQNQTKINQVLRPQVPPLLQSMQEAVDAEEKRLEEIRLLEEKRQAALAEAREAEARKIAEDAHRREEERRRVKQRLRGRCPAGFDWYRQGGGWRCHGGSHWVSDADLSYM
jgi:hypothetical protein